MDDAGRGRPENIALIGFMGSGKSAVGGILAGELMMEFVDLDEDIVTSAGKSVSEIFESEGDHGFRRRESQALQAALASGAKVISCGGGIVLSDDNVELLRSRCRVYLLRISQDQAMERLSWGGDRPLLAGCDLEEKVKCLMGERDQRYMEAAHEEVEAGGASPQQVAEEIVRKWCRYRYGHREENTPS